jgi:drug/metabolite transporter (DMT)-like permease
MGLVGLGVVSSILAFGFQVWAQQKIPSHTAAVLFLLESPFAALFGFWLLSETLSTAGIIGCVLILVACLLALKSLTPPKLEPKLDQQVAAIS